MDYGALVSSHGGAAATGVTLPVERDRRTGSSLE